MKTNPKRYFDVLDRAPRLEHAITDANTLRGQRRIESGVRTFLYARGADWLALLRMVKRAGRRTH